MSIRFNADEIFAMSEQIERNGARLYRHAADLAPDKENRRVLLDLAQMEDRHEKTFAGMRRRLSEEERKPVVFDPDSELGLYLEAMANENVFRLSADPLSQLRGQETLKDLLWTAIGVEKDSIAFYTGLKELVPERLGRDWVERIIREEFGHISTLNARLSELGG